MKIQEINSELKYQSKEYIKRKKKIKKRIFLIKFILSFILSIVAIVLLALSPIFNIKSIEVTGSQRYEQAEIIDSTSLSTGENGFKTIGNSIRNLFTLRYGLEEKNIIKKFPYVKKAYVRFILPDKIKISIIERKPIAYIKYNGSFLYIDNEAYVVDSIQEIKTNKIPEIKGLVFQSFETGQELEVEDKQCIVIYNKVFNAIIDSDYTDEFKIFNQVDYIDVSDLQRVIVNIDSRIKVNFGDLNDLTYRINYLKKNLMAISKEDRGFLDMTLEEPVFKPGIK